MEFYTLHLKFFFALGTLFLTLVRICLPHVEFHKLHLKFFFSLGTSFLTLVRICLNVRIGLKMVLIFTELIDLQTRSIRSEIPRTYSNLSSLVTVRWSIVLVSTNWLQCLYLFCNIEEGSNVLPLVVVYFAVLLLNNSYIV